MTTLTLYYAPGTCAQAVRIALEEAQAPYTPVRMDFASQQQRSPEYLAINPKGRVPALVTEHGVLTETPALLAYVAQRFVQAGLAPADAFGFARMQEFNSYLASTVHVAHAHRPRASRWADEPEAQAAMQRKVPANMTECFDVIERHYLGDGPWMLGEQYTVADGYLFTVAGWLKSDGVDIARFPKVHAHSQRMAARPAVQRALG
ncbi:glutathione S-transferase family protein [Alicycliphilus denitrificans]|uniref:Glutathione S-transferase domain protein n=1 Tax=Alicycliphilus denitrificans (strain DSM 14773 / CIP 107495 / K601) TaxID=596154 RepID=F4GEF4_ALIDK|nr:glutathione S-transferase family protein [Alicycliphilus denitrificans]ADU98073.1 Glutathione S-transferase domain protein [Alicycliphilus denitrificans BC]AEB82669.1 Glutathione S-transferase domain protein [Alicycliphilus denitrificans K601]GAO25971.1 glutathione S-transferase domain-containing protein [Alicycliphilus sp. B1]